MFCSNCGTAISTADKFCPYCGRQTASLGQPAGVFVRAIAIFIDALVLFIPSWLLAFATGGTTAHGFSLQGGSFFAALLIGFVYYVYFESQYGASPGKMAMGLKVIMANGEPCDIKAAVLRTVCRVVDGMFCYLIAALAVWFSANNQRLGDRVAGTLVVKK